jgi:integral membrane protein
VTGGGAVRFLSWLRWVALVEAVSWLVLLGIAMPLKYWGGMPRAVSVVGMAHGALFMLLLWLLLRAHTEAKWSRARIGLLFAASLVPVWPFLLDRRVGQWIAATAAEPR